MKNKYLVWITLPFIFISIIYMQNFSYALGFGQNITIYDNSSNTQDEWYGTQEDNEVEPEDQAEQKWDLEGFFLNGYKLSVIGGFDFKNGVEGITVGDIFLDIDGDARYGGDTPDPNRRRPNDVGWINDNYGYDYAIRLNFNNNIFKVFEIRNSDQLKYVYYYSNDFSSPWRYAKEYNKQNNNGLKIVYGGDFAYYEHPYFQNKNVLPTNLQGIPLQGSDHYGFSIDLSFFTTRYYIY